MADPKQIEITLTLKDEATKKIQSFRSSIKEFNNATKDTIAPVLQLRQAWMKAGLAVGFVVGAFTTGITIIKKYGEEIDKLDQLSIKLGVSTEELSKKLYGFNVVTDKSRFGTLAIKELELELERLKLLAGKILSEGIGQAKLSSKANEIAKRGQPQSLLGNIANLSLDNPALSLFRSYSNAENLRKYGDQAKKELLEELTAFKELEAIKKGLAEEVLNKTKQLSLSTTEFKDDLLKQELAKYQDAGVSIIELEKYKAAAIKRIQEEENNEYTKQLSVRYKAQGDTLEAMKQDQLVALNEYVRQWGPNGGAIGEFILGQKAQLEAAKRAWLGIRDQYQISQQAFNGYISASENTLSQFIEDGLHGSLQKSTDYFKMWGDEIIKIIAKVTAMMVILNAYSMMTGSGKKFGFMDTLKIISGVATLASGAGGTANIAGRGTVNTAPANYYLSSAARMAEGGIGIVRKPTLFMAGEAGPERYQFTPINKINKGEGDRGGNIIVLPIAFVCEEAISDDNSRRRFEEKVKAIVISSLRTNGVINQSIKRYIK